MHACVCACAPQLADFGVAHKYRSAPNRSDGWDRCCHVTGEGWLTATDGTFMFMPPECFTGEHYCGYCTDVWALGITLYVFLFGTVPFKTTQPGNMTEIFERIQKDE